MKLYQIISAEQGKCQEIWKDVIGFELLYQISNAGNFRSKTKIVNSRPGRLQKIKGKPLKTPINKEGYLMAYLSKNKKYSFRTIHRLVAIHFIPNQNNKPCVNHIDGNKLNNDVSNLEWCTYSENGLHASKMGLLASGADSAVAVLNKEQVVKIYFDIRSLTEIAKEYNISRRTVHSVRHKQIYKKELLGFPIIDRNIRRKHHLTSDNYREALRKEYELELKLKNKPL